MRAIHKTALALAFSLSFVLTGCPSGTEDDPDGGIVDAGPSLRCTDLVRPECEDDMFLEMNLQTTVAPGLIVNLADGEGGFDSHIDATAGGFMANPPHAYVYARFTENGLEKVELSDEDALLSHDWDIAFQRYVVRLNSGDSGPSCVEAASLPVSVTYDEVIELPNPVTWEVEDYYDASCTMIDDGTGLGTSPGSLLSSFYAYTSCVAMTGQIFVVHLNDGRTVKLEMESYYEPSKQEICNTQQTSPPPPTGSGNLRMHWAFIQ